LALWSRVVLVKLKVVQLVKKSLTFVQSASSLPCSKDPHNGVFNANEILKGCERGFCDGTGVSVITFYKEEIYKIKSRVEKYVYRKKVKWLNLLYCSDHLANLNNRSLSSIPLFMSFISCMFLDGFYFVF